MDKIYDFVILGTGLKNSILSAALAQRNKSIYHIDCQKNYGSYWSSLSFEEIYEIEKDSQIYADDLLSNFEVINNLNDNNVEQVNNEKCNEDKLCPSMISQQKCLQQPNLLTTKDMLSLSHKFKFDFFPKLFQNNSKLIQFVVESQIHHYLEFMTHGKNYMGDVLNQQSIIMVPFTRSDVFKSDQMSPMEKRSFVRFITNCLQEYAHICEFDNSNGVNMTFDHLSLNDIICKANITPKLSNILLFDSIIHDNLLINPKATSSEFFYKKIGSLTEALYKFNTKSTHICLRYGIGELSQAFCRVSAVYGTIFRLNVNKAFTIEENINDEPVFSIKLGDNDMIYAKSIIVEPKYYKYVSNKVVDEKSTQKLMRAILVTDKSLFPEENNNNDNSSSLLTILKKEIDQNDNSVNTVLLEVGTKLMVTPMNLKIVHLFKWDNCQSARISFDNVISNYFNMNKDKVTSLPTILYAVYFIYHPITTPLSNLVIPCLNNIKTIFTSYPDPSLDIDKELLELESIIETIDPKSPILLPRTIEDV